MRILLAALCGVCAWGQLNRPALGLMLDSSGAARPVFGLPGSISVGDPAATGVLSSACSATLCLIKTDTAIVSQGQPDVAAPPGRALFAFSGTGAYAYFPESSQLFYWNAGQLNPVAFDPAGEVLSIGAPDSGLQFAVRGEGGIRIVSAGNTVAGALPPDAHIAILLPGAVVYATPEEIVLLRPDASSMRFPLAHAVSFTQLGAGYVEIRAAGGTYALRVDAGRERLFLLPEQAQ